MDMGPATMDPVTAIMAAARPMSRMTTASGSDSVSGTAMAGGFAGCGFAADRRPSSLQTSRASLETARFRGRFYPWPEKTVFQAHEPKSVYFGLTVARFLERGSVSNTAW